MIRQIVYISGCRNPDTASVADTFLASARRRNAAMGLTGVLLFSEGAFFQVLEGPADAVETIYQRIARDTRHRHLIVMHDAEVRSHAFPDWSMGGFRLDPNEPIAERITMIAAIEDVTRRQTETAKTLDILIGSFLATSRG